MGKSQELYRKAKTMIPGGTQLLSKRPEMFLPDIWPAYYSKAKGCEVWDLDDNVYFDMSTMGIGSCVLGYADDDINKAVITAIKDGSMSTLNAPEEVELSELLIHLHPWSQMVRYARTGGEAMAMAVRIARAKSGKDVVLFCGYHGWHDWYLSTNIADNRALEKHLLPGLNPLGVPRSLKGSSIPFKYNDTAGFLALLKEHKNNVGAVVLETIRNFEPKDDFFVTVRKATSEYGVPFVLDEITSGWRLNVGGAHLKYGLEPDIAVFGKAISNGFPMAAIIGKKDVMEASQDSFISSTYWTDRIGPVAAVATIKKMMREGVPERLNKVGIKIKQGWLSCAARHNLDIHVEGIDPLSHFDFEYDNPLILKTLFTQLMLEKGYLASTAFYASIAHENAIITRYLEAVDETFEFIAKAIKEKNPTKYLKGPVCHSGFKRLT